MMHCGELKNLNGCGSCTISLSNSDSIKQLTTLSMYEVIDVILEFCTYNPDKEIVLEESILDCRGNITVLYTQLAKEKCNYKNRVMCKRLINSWCKYHTEILGHSMIAAYLFNLSSVLSTVNSDNEMCKEATELNEILGRLNRNCVT